MSQNQFVNGLIQRRRRSMKEISVIGIDLAKEVFQLHGADRQGKPVLKKKISSRAKLLEFVANLQPCLIGMEACSGASFWAREFLKHGHEVKLMAGQFVKPYVKSNKNDAADAEAIAEAVVRPNMRFVPIKHTWQQDLQMLHRIRQRLVRNRTAVINELHGLLLEYGIALPRSKSRILKELALLLAPESEKLSQDAKICFEVLVDELKALEIRVEQCSEKIERFAAAHEVCQRIQKIPGVGVMTSTAVIAAVGDPKLFKNGRQFSAWLGLVPRQSSSGGKSVLLGISKRGDPYIRSLLVHGGRSVLRVAHLKTDRVSQWALRKAGERGQNRAVVAVANKNARIIWSLMSSGKEYQSA
jgi:transposase